MRASAHTKNGNRQRKADGFKRCCLFDAVRLGICKQNAQVVSAAIQNTVNVDVTSLDPVENHIVSADQEPVLVIHIRDGGKRRAEQGMVTEHTDMLRDLAYCGERRPRIFPVM